MNIIHRFHDQSMLCTYSAKELIQIPIWNGNRILDESHRETIRSGIQGKVERLDSKPYHVVTLLEEVPNGMDHKLYLVDGQHRASILREWYTFQPQSADFTVLVVVKECQNEREVIRYFKELNTTKSIEWKEDPVLAANRYVDAILQVFHTHPKKLLFRNGKTRKPYISVDVLRQECKKRRLGMNPEDDPKEFAKRLWEDHEQHLQSLRRIDPESLTAIEKRCLEVGFILSLDEKFEWLNSS